MHGAPGFGIYGMDIFVKTDDAENAVELIKEIRNQEKQQKIGILDKKNWIQMTKGEWLKLFSFFYAIIQKNINFLRRSSKKDDFIIENIFEGGNIIDDKKNHRTLF